MTSAAIYMVRLCSADLPAMVMERCSRSAHPLERIRSCMPFGGGSAQRPSEPMAALLGIGGFFTVRLTRAGAIEICDLQDGSHWGGLCHSACFRRRFKRWRVSAGGIDQCSAAFSKELPAPEAREAVWYSVLRRKNRISGPLFDFHVGRRPKRGVNPRHHPLARCNWKYQMAVAEPLMLRIYFRFPSASRTSPESLLAASPRRE